MRNVLDGIAYVVVHAVDDISDKVEKEKKGLMAMTTVYKIRKPAANYQIRF
jgi:hypothetical protein